MTTQVRRSSRKRTSHYQAETRTTQGRFFHYLPAWVLLAGVLVILMPQILTFAAHSAVTVVEAVPDFVSRLFARPSAIAPLFTDQVDHWAGDIRRWSEEYDLDPNLLATVMQIESCGHPTVGSSAGAQGLFQVMPFHFDAGEKWLDPDTNAKRAAAFLKECLGYANGDTGLAMACYNGGPSVITKNYAYWSAETQRYYTWGTGIYADAVANSKYSETLTRWLVAGGVYLCDKAGVELGIN